MTYECRRSVCSPWSPTHMNSNSVSCSLDVWMLDTHMSCWMLDTHMSCSVSCSLDVSAGNPYGANCIHQIHTSRVQPSHKLCVSACCCCSYWGKNNYFQIIFRSMGKKVLWDFYIFCNETGIANLLKHLKKVISNIWKCICQCLIELCSIVFR